MTARRSCVHCGAEFATAPLRKRRTVCRDCQAAYQRRWYVENRERCLVRARRNAKRSRAEAKALVQALKAAPCADCGGRFPAEVMDFDHVRGQKIAPVSLLKNGSVERILREVAKCDLVCANCHRVRTAKRMESTRRVYWSSNESGEPRA